MHLVISVYRYSDENANACGDSELVFLSFRDCSWVVQIFRNLTLSRSPMWISICPLPPSKYICKRSALFSPKLVANSRPRGLVVLNRTTISSACVLDSSGINAVICCVPFRCSVDASAIRCNNLLLIKKFINYKHAKFVRFEVHKMFRAC